MAKIGNGDWIPKERWREGDGDQGKSVKFGLYTVFVDNLPSAMVAKTLFKLFSQFGIVKEVFIPLKRRTVSKSSFGFVRFNCPVAADIAIQKGNGLLVEERVLEVKIATKDRSFRFEQSRRASHSINRPPDPISYKAQVPCSGQRSFAEVLKGVTPTEVRKESLSIKANEEDLGWLHGSVIVRLNSEFSTVNIGNILKEKGLDHVMVRKGGGRDIVLTFKSQEELKSNLCNIKEWFKEWSQFVMEWKPGFFLAQERCVWLRCYGIPLNLWNRGTINKIGSMWGTVLSLDGDFCQPKSFSHTRIRVATSCMEFINKTISLDCKGILHPILVCEDLSAESSSLKGYGLEECSSNEIHGSVMERSSPEKCFREKESDHVLQVNPVVEESKWDKGFIREEEVSTKELDQRIGSNDCHLGEEVNTVIEETSLEESGHSPNVIVEQVSTPGFIKSFSGSRVGSGIGINLEVDLSQALSKNLNRKGLLSLNQSGLVRQPTSVPKSLRDEKRRRKKKVQLEGFSSFARLHGQKVAAVNKHTSKSVIFRPAAAAIARSDLSEDITSPNNLLLNEAKATIQLGFKVTSKGCCGSGLIEYSYSCKGLSTCADPTKYIFWDAVHPTEKMYEILAGEAIKAIAYYMTT